MSDVDSMVRLIAFYLPQFHPIPENDQWWGKGFTEWTNVTKARSKFSNHYQPHLPADLGFYDLRLPEARQAQADLAREYGIHGFCHYHYWFNGRQLLERPFDEVLSSGRPDFPFCLCWANEDWTRAWDGNSKEQIMTQCYSDEDDLEHIKWLCKAFHDPRYIRVEDKPLFLVYRASLLPNPLKTTEIWRKEARNQGFGDLHLCRVESFRDEGDPTAIGFDAAVEFQPDFARLGPPLFSGRRWLIPRLLGIVPIGLWQNSVLDYSSVVDAMLKNEDLAYLRYPCVTPMWDNSARRETGAIILRNSTPELYERWLREIIARSKAQRNADRIVFVNAWNEWAEGCHLEPCQRWGNAYLEATRRAMTESRR
ncbi:MAG: glycosyltransferase WbsX family protein [Armatimonadota bacterium]